MVGEHQPVPIGRKPDQRKAHAAARAARSKRSARSCARIAGQALLAFRFIQPRQIDAAPGRRRLRHDDLHRPAQMLVPEARPQAGMTRHQRLHRRRQRRAVERALQLQIQLHRIDVRRLRVIKRMEQQPLLQRRQRQDVLDLRIRAAPAARSRPASAQPAADRSGCGRRPRAAAAWRTSAASAPNQRSARSRTSASVSSAGAHDQVAVSACALGDRRA